MIQRLKQFVRLLLERCRFLMRQRRAGVPQRQNQPAQSNIETGTQHRIPRPNRHPNPVLQAFNEIFAPRHAAEEQVLFRPVQPDGTTIEKSEEWFHEGNSLKTVSKRGLVITCSGEIVMPADIKVKCAICGGFDSAIVRCSHPQCGVPLCRLHQRIFASPSGPVVFCEKHYRKAIESFDTWAAFDHAKNPIRRKL
jgi:hypothetical protein